MLQKYFYQKSKFKTMESYILLYILLYMSYVNENSLRKFKESNVITTIIKIVSIFVQYLLSSYQNYKCSHFQWHINLTFLVT